MYKLCTICKKKYPLDQYPVQKVTKTNKTYLKSACSICSNNQYVEYNKRNREKRNAYSKIYYARKREYWKQYAKDNRKNNPDKYKDTILRSTRGISLEEFKEKLKNQNDSCAICGVHKDKYFRFLNVDHNHTTGKVRGLLCNNCNRGIAFYEKFSAKCIDYLFIFD